MAMFTQSDKNDAPTSDKAETFIGPSVKLEGNFNSDGDIVVEGFLSGTLVTRGNVRIGPDAVIDAQITANSVHVAGKIKGNINASGTIRLAGTAIIQGDIKTGSIAVEEGATVNGKVNMGGKEKIKSPRPIITEPKESEEEEKE